ncbi:metallophosphoesterase [Ottowia sp. VDI28]|uniref:metallophosphoesterase n=1 Tax=Ottowia sp. VDI28 TaxID=3133968 RepID=UPI003C2BF53F
MERFNRSSFAKMNFHLPRPRRAPLLLAPLALATALAACGGSDDASEEVAPLDLTIAHINDHHSNLDPIADQTMQISGIDTQVELGGFARVTNVFKQYAGREDVLKLHAGDANTGTLYYTLFKGKADADMMNTICFDAMAVGNHEFDDGDAQLKSFIEYLQAGSCNPRTGGQYPPASGHAAGAQGRKRLPQALHHQDHQGCSGRHHRADHQEQDAKLLQPARHHGLR